MRAIVLVGFLASLIAALHLSTVNLNRAYYGTDTRAYELLAGALLAMTPRVMRIAQRRRRAIQVLAPVNLAILIGIATSSIHLGAIQRGVAATVTTCALIVALEVSAGGPVKRALSSPSAVYLGRISYGTYLWHWPVIVIATTRFKPNAISLFALTCLVGTALASLSFQLLEQRVRLSRLLDLHRSAVIAIGLAVSLVGGLVIVPSIMRHDSSSAATSTAVLGASNAGVALKVRVPHINFARIESASYGATACYGKPAAKCILTHGSGPTVLLMGDSHALAFVPAFAGLALRRGLTFAVATSPNCPWQRGIVEAPNAAPTDLPQQCHAHQDDWYDRIVPDLHPDIIVLIHRSLDDPNAADRVRLANGKVITSGTPSFEAALRDATTRSLQALRAPGRKIIILEPLPIAPTGFDPFTCLSKAKFLEDCRYVASGRPSPLERFYRSLADGRSTYTLDLDRLVCPYLPICDPIVNGTVVKKDAQHITAGYSKTLTGPIDTVFTKDGILPRRG